MSSLVITLPGSSGDQAGPQGIFDRLIPLFKEVSIDMEQIKGIQDDFFKTLEHAESRFKQRMNSYDNIYLLGYSMGGGVAVQLANKVAPYAKDKLKGITLLSTQTEGLLPLESLKIPTLFYHGSEDEYFPTWQLESCFSRCKNFKSRFITATGLNHSLRDSKTNRSNPTAIALSIFEEMKGFHLDKSESFSEEKIIDPLPPSERILTKLFKTLGF